MKFFIKEFKESTYWLMLVIVLMIFVSIMLFTSCSTTQKTFTQKERELFTPTYNSYKVTGCDENYIYLEGREPLKNIDKDTLHPGDFIILIPQFERNRP